MIEPHEWRAALGKIDRAGDWAELLSREIEQEPWRDVLIRWWPRLLPGIAAGATHGVIRVGHAVNGLLQTESEPRIHELALALAYWASRWQPVTSVRPNGSRSVRALLSTLPRIQDQSGGIAARLAQLDNTAQWAERAGELGPPLSLDAVPAALGSVIDAAVATYPQYASGNPTMLVHAATAPNAVAMALQALPTSLWADSFTAAWSASAAVFSAYAPATPDTAIINAPTSPQDALDIAIDHGGEHVIKFADTALSSYDRTQDSIALVAAVTAARLDA